MTHNTLYKLGKEINIWKDGLAQTLTFIVTEDCNLRSSYCYITHKSSTKKMSFDVAKKFIDYVLLINLQGYRIIYVEDGRICEYDNSKKLV